MACDDFNILGDLGFFLQRERPRNYAIGAAKDRGRWYGRCRFEMREHVFVLQLMAANHFVESPCIGGLWIARERGAERNDAAHLFGQCLRKFACIKPAHAPTDQAHFAIGSGVNIHHAIYAFFQYAIARAKI